MNDPYPELRNIVRTATEARLLDDDGKLVHAFPATWSDERIVAVATKVVRTVAAKQILALARGEPGVDIRTFAEAMAVPEVSDADAALADALTEALVRAQLGESESMARKVAEMGFPTLAARIRKPAAVLPFGKREAKR